VNHSSLAAAGATVDVLRRHGLYTKKSLGQHFLVDDNVVGRILTLAAIAPDDVVLEVGPGIGTLTVALCAAAREVVAVEADPRLLPVLAETTGSCPCGVRVVLADAVTVDPAQVSGESGAPSLLVANLPYGVAATVVLRFFEILPSLRAATVMVQAEVADRMTADPGRKAYGAYTVKLGLLAEPAGRFRVGAGSFLPPPRVESAVVRLERRAGVSAADERLVRAAATADAAFSQRRKTLRNALSSALGAAPSIVEEALRTAGYDPAARAESLGIDAFVDIGAALHDAGCIR
jgi:16S rRNA (adenine1518-N6/adenine1519-N6)-dimethyltransferase